MNLPNDLKYASSHEWAKLEADDVVRVGISDFAQQQLGDVVYVELPEVGKAVQQGKASATIESVKAASDIYSPVTGTIVQVNDALRDSPEQVNADSYEAWLFCVKASDVSELGKLLSADAYRAQVNE